MVLTAQAGLMNFFEPGAMEMTTAADVANLAGKTSDTRQTG
jgi:hypothetical protein